MRRRRVFSSAPDFWHLAQGSHDFGKQKLQDIGGEISPCLWLVAAFPIPSAPARPLTSHLPLLRTQLTCTFHAFPFLTTAFFHYSLFHLHYNLSLPIDSPLDSTQRATRLRHYRRFLDECERLCSLWLCRILQQTPPAT